MKVTLFLDVDGVMSPFPHGSKAWPDYVKHRYGFNLSLSKQLADAVQALPCEKVWLTTWENLANQVIVPKLGWEPLPVIERSRYSEWIWWKLDFIKEFDKTNQPFIWTDDDIKFSLTEVCNALPIGNPLPEDERPWTAATWSTPRRMLVSPETEKGLTPDHIMAMWNFIQEWKDK